MKKIRSGIAILLKKNISKGQLTGYSLANIIGLTVILSGILFYCDSRHHQTDQDQFFSDDYIVVSKKVTGVNLEPVNFSEEEIKDLASQPWVKNIGRFTTADFSVNATINMGGRGMSSFLFFESVPDDFFDSKPASWGFDPSSDFVPIVLNKDYLALYNFGFAIPQGLPQISEDIISTIPLKLYVTGKNGKSLVMNAGVVGFSSRLNTIAVPQDFMEWANANFSNDYKEETARLIIKIDKLNPSDSEKYIRDNNLEIAGDKETDSKISRFMGIVSGVVTATGLVICLLSLFILILSIFLLLQKSRPMLRNLILLGYSPNQAARFYEETVIKINACITIVSVGLSFLCRLIWKDSLDSLGLGNGNVLFMLGAALIYFIVVDVINVVIIRNHLNKIWNLG